MKSKFYIAIQARIIIIGLIMIFGSFIPDYLHEFFGDWYCHTGSGQWIYSTQAVAGHYTSCSYGGEHGPTWHWGVRHWYFFAMVIMLLIVNIISMTTWVHKKSEKKEI